MICECSDPRCPAHAGPSCEQVATATLYRVDMTDETSTAMCSGCADDAMESGLFTTDPDDESESGSDEPEDGDITTSDHLRFYQYGKLWLEIDEDDDMWQQIETRMSRDNFYPNVWFISDHGNAHLINLGE